MADPVMHPIYGCPTRGDRWYLPWSNEVLRRQVFRAIEALHGPPQTGAAGRRALGFAWQEREVRRRWEQERPVAVRVSVDGDVLWARE